VTGSVSGRTEPVFAHASEAEMARILDFYDVRWHYEPHTFPILWTLDGDVAESFSPDFFLPDVDLYLEMTTLRQRLVRKKNRKLRRLRELYPAVNIKLFYARDFRALMLKYGKVALADALSGTAGQPGPRVPPAATSADPRSSATILDGSPPTTCDGIGTGAHPHADRMRGAGTTAAAARRRSRRRRRSAPAGEGEPAAPIAAGAAPSTVAPRGSSAAAAANGVGR
jgi:hypothetical protein